MPIIDTHCHLNDERLFADVGDIVAAFAENEIESAICVGFDLPSSIAAAEQATEYDAVYGAVGIHPHDSKTANNDAYDEIARLAANEKIVAIGEIGLDYFYDLSPRDVQMRCFIEQLELANSLKLPVILHIRDAYEDARKILFGNRDLLKWGVQLHCYSGSREYVKIFDALDCFYSFGGAITFKNAKHNLESLACVPHDRLLLETDSPYMTPTPFRGQTNYPKYIGLVASKAAEILETERAELIETTTNNARALFNRLK